MKRKIITLTAAVLAMLLISVAIALPASAGEYPKRLLIIGDSISTGYGLAGTPNENRGYSNQLAKALGIEGANYVNKAVNGYTSSQMLALIPTIKAEVEKTELIVITTGGNDLLQCLKSVVGAASGNSSASLPEIALKLSQSDEATIQSLLYSDSAKAAFVAMNKKLGENVVAMIALLKEYNPSAQIVFLTQYNPIDGTSYTAMNKAAVDIISTLNITLKTAYAAGGVDFVDTYPSFIGKGGTHTNIYLLDIHPNQKGHDLLFSLLAEHLHIVVPSDTTDATTTAVIVPPTTTAATTTAAPVITTAPPVTTAQPTVTTSPAEETTVPTEADTTLPTAEATTKADETAKPADTKKSCFKSSAISAMLQLLFIGGTAAVFATGKKH